MSDLANPVFLSAARRGIRIPICADLVLNQASSPNELRANGGALGQMLAGIAQCYRSPFVFPLMDLRLEKADLCAALGVSDQDSDAFQFAEPPSAKIAGQVRADTARPFGTHAVAGMQAIRYLSEKTSLLPLGMVIGPFSLTSKLMKDPITAVALAGRGASADDHTEILLLDRCLELATQTVERSVNAQLSAGAKAVVVCEPAASTSFFSPRQLAKNPALLDRYVLAPNRRIRDLLSQAGAALIFHNCGQLTSALVQRFATDLRPAMLSLGSSRRLWEDAGVVPKETVLYGNLPTKSFYSDADLPRSRVQELARELREKMQASGHPHILGSECDVLHVPDAADTIREKVELAFGGCTGH